METTFYCLASLFILCNSGFSLHYLMSNFLSRHLFLLSAFCRDPNAFYMKVNLDNVFVDQGLGKVRKNSTGYNDFRKVCDHVKTYYPFPLWLLISIRRFTFSRSEATTETIAENDYMKGLQTMSSIRVDKLFIISTHILIGNDEVKS